MKVAKKNKKAVQKQQSQTDAYLSVPSNRELVQARWAQELITYKDFIDKILQQERASSEDYYIFYHAQMREFCIMHDFLKEFFNLCMLNKPFEDFTFLRMWTDGVVDRPVPSLDIFIDAYEYDQANDSSRCCCCCDDSGRCSWNDNEDYLRRTMLSVNLSLFGNTSWINRGECTFDFFIHSFNFGIDYFYSFYQKMFEKCGLSYDCASAHALRLDEIAQSYDSGPGILLQICIPKNMVDSCVYLSHDYGTPYRKPIVAADFDSNKCRHKTISSVLELYKNNPEAIKNIDSLQARIVFFPELLDPESGIKIYRYAPMLEGKDIEYTQKIKALAQEAFTDMLAQDIIKRSTSDNDYRCQYEGRPLDILMGVMVTAA